jgi:hypothetical protein
MADNVVVTPGTGKTIIADEVIDGTFGTGAVQYVKIMDGTPDGTTKYGGITGLPTAIYDAAAPTTSSLTAADVATATVTGFNNVSYFTGTPTAASSASISFNGENAVAIQLTGTWVGTVTFERTMDGTTWHSATAINMGNPYTSVTGNGIYYINAAGAIAARVRLTAFTSGTVTTALYAATGVFPISVVNAQLGQYNATPPTITSGMTNALQLDVNGNQKQNLATRLDAVNDAVTSYDFGHSFTPISTATTTTAKSGAGVLKRIIVTSPGATSNTIKIYDNTAASGTVIADWSTAGGVPTTGVFDFDIAFTSGLTVVTAGTTPPILTVVWR